MRIAVMGTGGVGGYFGTKLALAGNDVTFIARGAHLAAMRRDGLRVQTQGETLHVHPAQATDDPAEVGPVDVVLFTVKLWDTVNAARAIGPLLGPDTMVISFQNGVEHDDEIAREIGGDHVVTGIAYIAALIGEPGTIVHNGAMARIAAGERDGRMTPRLAAFVAAARAAGIDVTVPDDVAVAVWEKFVFLSALSGVTSYYREPIGPIRDDPERRALFLDAMREAVAVARAKGIGVREDHAERTLAFADTLPAAMRASMAGDLERGNRLELDWLSGAVVRFGSDVGVATPASRAIADALAPLAGGAAAR